MEIKIDNMAVDNMIEDSYNNLLVCDCYNNREQSSAVYFRRSLHRQNYHLFTRPWCNKNSARWTNSCD